MNLVVTVPRSWASERRYIWSLLLGDMLGIATEINESDVAETSIEAPGLPGRVSIPEGMFRMAPEDWLSPGSLPSKPTARLRLDGLESSASHPSDCVAIYGRESHTEAACTLAGSDARIHFDIAGSAFFMLSRYEEAVAGPRDAHDRFPASAALAFQEGFLHRPVVNEYSELLFTCLSHCWPGLRRRRREYRLLVSHDIDSGMFHLGCSAPRLLRAAAWDLIDRRDPALAMRRLASRLPAQRGDFRGDPHNTYDYLMGVSEKHSLRSAFYFIAGGDSPLDSNYTMDMPWVQEVVRRIGERGHEIGLHPSYATYLDAAETRRQFDTLKRCAERNGVDQHEWGGRQHYLRWRAGTTWANWARAGLDYDSSLGFAETTGFRAGCCHEFRAYDINARQELPLRERPLLLMETTLFASGYMNLTPAQRLETTRKVHSACRLYGGDMTLLWHNSRVASRSERAEYESVIRICLGVE